MSDIGTRFTELQERVLGAFSINSPHGSNKGPGVVNYASANGVIQEDSRQTGVGHDGTNDEHAASAIAPRPDQIDAGLVVLIIGWKINVGISGWDNPSFVGSIHRDPVDGLGNNYAAFRPHTADVAVNRNGTVTTASITYPQVDQFFFYSALAIDYDDQVTEFFIDINPYTDSPDATIDAVPDGLGPIGILMEGGTDAFERLRVTHSGYILVI